MKLKRWFIYFAFAFVFIFSGCVKQQTAQLQISATIYPLYDIIKNIAGDRAEVSLIVSPGSSPHTFAPVPTIMKKISQSKAVFMIGLGLEQFMEKIKSQYPEINYVELGKKLKTHRFNTAVIEPDEPSSTRNRTHSGHSHQHSHNHSHDHSHHHEGVDPHVWLDPVNVLVMIELIASELSHIDPENKNIYEKNAALYKEKIVQLDKKIKEIISRFKNRNIVTFHDAFGYFAKRYGVHVVASFEPWPGKEPSVKYRKKLVDAIKKLKKVSLFYEPQFNPAALKSLAIETGVKIGMLDPIGSPEIPGRSTYIELMEFNLNNLKEALH